MSTASHALPNLPARFDEHRGLQGMLWFILTEAMLFVALFFSYYLLASQNPHWPLDDPPKLKLALIMLVVLLTSSGVVEWGRQRAKHGDEGKGRLALGVTIVLGLVFLGLQALEYRDHLKTLRPTTDAYGSLFYTITGIHGLHVMLGLLMLGYVLLLPHIGPGANKSPHRPLHTASLYWHFVDGVWVVIVTLLYVVPNLRAG